MIVAYRLASYNRMASSSNVRASVALCIAQRLSPRAHIRRRRGGGNSAFGIAASYERPNGVGDSWKLIRLSSVYPRRIPDRVVGVVALVYSVLSYSCTRHLKRGASRS